MGIKQSDILCRFKKTSPRSREEISGKPVEKKKDHYFLGNEMAYAAKKGKRTYFMIGGKLQTENDFERQLVGRLGIIFKDAWEESLKIIQGYPKEVLLSQNRFFQESTDREEMSWHRSGPR